MYIFQYGGPFRSVEDTNYDIQNISLRARINKRKTQPIILGYLRF